MKVKVGDKIYDGEKEPVMVILTEQDRRSIEMMSDDATRYAQFPGNIHDGSTTEAEIDAFMDVPADELPLSRAEVKNGKSESSNPVQERP